MNAFICQQPRPGLLALTGELTIGDAPALQALLVAELGAHPALEIDLLNVTIIDTAGVQLLVAAQRAATRAGKSLSWLGFSHAVEEALEMLGLRSELGEPGAVVWE